MERTKWRYAASGVLFAGMLSAGLGSCSSENSNLVLPPTPEQFGAHETTTFRSFMGAQVRVHSEGDFRIEQLEFDELVMQSLEYLEEAPASITKDRLLRVKNKLLAEEIPYTGKSIDIVVADDPATCLKRGIDRNVYGFEKIPPPMQAEIDNWLLSQSGDFNELCDTYVGFTLNGPFTTFIAVAPAVIGPTDQTWLEDTFNITDATPVGGKEPFVGIIEETYDQSVKRVLRHEIRHMLASYDRGAFKDKEERIIEEDFISGMDFLYAQKHW